MTVDWAAAAKFLLSENSDKTPLTELAKNQAFPLFMAACGWRRPGFFTPSVTFENRARPATQMSFSPNSEKKTPFDVSTSRHIISELWLWHFMAACTSANTFVVYKHFFQKTKLDTWTWTTPLSRIQNSITGLFSICFVKIVLHKPSHDMRLNLSQRTCGYSNRCQMGSRIVWMYGCAGYGWRVWGCMAGYPGPICRHGVRWSHWGIGLPA